MTVGHDNWSAYRPDTIGRRRPRFRAVGRVAAVVVGLAAVVTPAMLTTAAPARADHPVCTFMKNGRTPEQVANSVWVDGYWPDLPVGMRIMWIRQVVADQCPQFLSRF